MHMSHGSYVSTQRIPVKFASSGWLFFSSIHLLRPRDSPARGVVGIDRAKAVLLALLRQ